MIFKSKSKQQQPTVDWTSIESEEDLVEAYNASFIQPIVIFKHSSKCLISKKALSKFEKELKAINSVTPYFINVIQNKDLAHQVAKSYEVDHQSPQILVIKDGQCVNHASHSNISAEMLK